MKTSIIIVNHNTAEVLKECVESVFKFEDRESFDIVIVDNASKDNSMETINGLCNSYQNVQSIFLDELKSFSYANNRGIDNTKGEYVLIMNPDIIFEEPVLGIMTEYFAANRNTGAISPALIGTDGNFQRNYFQRYPTIKQFIFFHSIVLRYFYKSQKMINKYLLNDEISVHDKKLYFVEQIPCAFFLTTRAILKETGMMDENFILFFEDVDLSYRIKMKHDLVVDTNIHVKHIGGSSFKDVEWWTYGRFLVSMLYFFRKHYSIGPYYLLRFLAVSNARLILLIEKISSIFGKQSDFRIKKYRNFLNILKQS